MRSISQTQRYIPHELNTKYYMDQKFNKKKS